MTFAKIRLRAFCAFSRSVKNYSHANPEIMLSAVEQPRRVVVDLNDADINSIARANVDTTSKRGRKPCFLGREIIRTRAGKDGYTTFGGEVHAIATMRNTSERMSEWLEYGFRRVVFDLNASEKVVDTRIDVQRALGWAKGN